MTWNELEDKIMNLRVWESKGKRAPHKHFLFLLILQKFLQTGNSHLKFSDIEKELKSLLEEFGPQGKNGQKPENPFYHLSSSTIWKIDGNETIKKGESPTARKLRDGEFEGRLIPEVEELLTNNRDRIPQLAAKVINQNFDPESEELKRGVLEAVGIEKALSWALQESRDPDFRNNILIAYNEKCAVCGFDARLDRDTIGLDAAHIKWHKAKGPNTIKNGLALCPTHHRLFDRGAFTIKPGTLEFTASSRLSGDNLQDWIFRYNGSPLLVQPHKSELPDRSYLDWHWSEVFKGPVSYKGIYPTKKWAADE